MDRTEWSIKLANLAALEDRAKRLRAELTANPPEDMPASATTAQLPDGTPLATLTYREGYTRTTVSDRDQLCEWASRNHPSMVGMAVTPQFEGHLRKLGTHQDIPGIKASKVKPTWQVTLLEDAFDLLWLHKAENPQFAAMLDLA